MVGWVQKAASLMLHTEATVSLNLTSIVILYLKIPHYFHAACKNRYHLYIEADICRAPPPLPPHTGLH